MSTRKLWYGQATAASIPAYWQAASVTADGGVAFGLRAESNILCPAGLGGECIFAWAYVTVTANAGATLRVTPVIDGSTAMPVVPNGSLVLVTPTFVVPQLTGERVTTTFPVPMTVRLLNGSGVEQSRWYCRGAQAQVRVESVGAIGAGDVILDGVEFEYAVVRRSLYPTVAVT